MCLHAPQAPQRHFLDACGGTKLFIILSVDPVEANIIEITESIK
jgi:hypothetical protein